MSSPTGLGHPCILALGLMMAIMLNAVDLRASVQDATEADESPTAPVVVVRFSANFFQQLFAREIQRDIRFQERVLDALCDGVAQVSGESSIDFVSADLDRPLNIVLTGTMQIDCKGYIGPFVSSIESVVPYSVVYQLNFNGTEFYGAGTWADAELTTSIKCVATCRQGVGHRAVGRVAQRLAPNLIGDYEEAAKHILQRKLIAEVNATMQEVLEHINKSVEVEATIVRLLESHSYERRITKTDEYLQVRIAKVSSDQQPPIDSSMTESMVEIWVYPKQATPELVVAAIRWQGLPAGMRAILPPSMRELIDFNEENAIETVGDWDVIRIGRVELSEVAPLP